jgi:hypothetical protein
MPTRGVTYVAWGKCIKEAEKSAQSARKFGLKTCLIAPAYSGKAFDRFVATQQKLEYSRQRAFVYHLSPWEQTLYLDADTVVLGDLSFGFEMAHKHGIALAIAPACFLKHHWQLEHNGFPEDLPEYNAGVIFLDRRHPGMQNFWQQVQEELRDFSSYQNPPGNDQPALSLLLYRKGINPYVLPQNWNLRTEYGMRAGFGPVKIWHSRQPIPRDFAPEQRSWWSLDKTEI